MVWRGRFEMFFALTRISREIFRSAAVVQASFVVAISLLAMPFLLDAVIYRPALFKTVATTGAFSAELDPESLVESIKIELADLVLCELDEALDSIIEVGVCAGFSSQSEFFEASIRIYGASTLTVQNYHNGTIVVDLASRSSSQGDLCFARTTATTSSQKDPRLSVKPVSLQLCGSFRLVLVQGQETKANWLVFAVSELVVGRDIGPGERVSAGGVHSGVVNVFSTSLQGDVHDALAGKFNPLTGNFTTGGLSMLKSHALNLADVVRFERSDSLPSKGYLTARMEAGRNIDLSAWNIAEYATVSTFGMPNLRIYTTYFERLSNDEFVEYWIAFAILVLPLLLRSFGGSST